MHKKPSRKQHILKRAIIYFIMTVSVGCLVLALIYVVLGYQLNSRDGTLEQGGLMQFDSRPGGAAVYLDGSKLALSTAGKLTAAAGDHTVMYTKPGYTTWKKDITLKPRGILWLTYARMIPENLITDYPVAFEALTSSSISPDGKWLIVKEQPADPNFSLVSLDTDKPKKMTISLPADRYTRAVDGAKPHGFSIESWDKSSRYSLIRHEYDDKIEWLSLDTRDVQQSKNITATIGVAASQIEYSVGDTHILYAIVDGVLRKINLNDATLSRPLVANVATFSQFDRATVVYTTALNDETKKRSVGYYTDNAKAPRIVREYADDGTPALDLRIGEYFGDKYFVILHGRQLEVMTADLPSSDSGDVTSYRSVTSMRIPSGDGRFLRFSPSGRFVIVQQAGQYLTYDIELQRATTTMLWGESEVVRPLQWLDDYHIYSDRDGVARSYEFDGLNPRQFKGVHVGQAAVLSANDKYLYTIGTNDAGVTALARTKLVID